MILDLVDLNILKLFCKLKDNEYTTTWEIMKKIYPRGGDSLHMGIKRKIARMSDYCLFNIEGKPKTYTLNSDKVFLRKFSFPDRRCLAISILIDDRWIIFEL